MSEYKEPKSKRHAWLQYNREFSGGFAYGMDTISGRALKSAQNVGATHDDEPWFPRGLHKISSS